MCEELKAKCFSILYSCQFLLLDIDLSLNQHIFFFFFFFLAANGALATGENGTILLCRGFLRDLN